jgi:hypothetical protein
MKRSFMFCPDDLFSCLKCAEGAKCNSPPSRAG